MFDKKGVDQLRYVCPMDLLTWAQLPFRYMYSLSEPELKGLKEYVTGSLCKGFIRSSTFPGGDLIFFVANKNDSPPPPPCQQQGLKQGNGS